MKKFWISLMLIMVFLIVGYIAGPSPSKPKFNNKISPPVASMAVLEEQIKDAELALKTVKKDNEARIIWVDSLRKEKTRYSIVYLHGFGASQAEGAPVHTQLARKFGCNLYLARLRDHGVNKTDVFADLTAENLWETARHAITVGKQLGDSVIVMGTSTGGSFALYAASQDPAIKALVVYSPLIDFYSATTALIDKPWGLEIMRMVMGSDYMEFKRNDSLQDQYWISKYRLEGLVALKNFVAHTMTEETFQRIKCPVFLGYYYNNEDEQDNVVSVPAMLDMYTELGAPETFKRKVAFPKSGHHVIASYIRSKDWQGVRDETVRFFTEILNMQPVAEISPEMSTIKS
jgi:pimeloyl-ACP methyl ester carboxylesterase